MKKLSTVLLSATLNYNVLLFMTKTDRYCPYNSLVIACDFHSFTSEICADFQQLTSYSLEDSLGKSLVIARNFQPFPSDQIETLPFVSL